MPEEEYEWSVYGSSATPGVEQPTYEPSYEDDSEPEEETIEQPEEEPTTPSPALAAVPETQPEVSMSAAASVSG
jgi:hypothetical protein